MYILSFISYYIDYRCFKMRIVQWSPSFPGATVGIPQPQKLNRGIARAQGRNLLRMARPGPPEDGGYSWEMNGKVLGRWMGIIWMGVAKSGDHQLIGKDPMIFSWGWNTILLLGQDLATIHSIFHETWEFTKMEKWGIRRSKWRSRFQWFIQYFYK